MKVKEMCLSAMMIVLIIVSAFIKIPIGFVPMTMQTLAILLTSLILKEKAVYSVGIYILMGLIGLPVFTNGGGLGYIFMPTFGYLLGFLFCSWFVGNYKRTSWMSLLVRCFIGVMLIYGVGISYFLIIQFFYMGQSYTMTYIFTTLFLIYIPGDSLSIILAISIFYRMNHYNFK